MGYPKLIKSEIKLTIGMLVSNHIQYIRKAMEALQPLLKAVPSELIVVDTKGAETDGSIEIVKEYTDKIYPFTWCNDFAAARNVCMDHAKGEWFLFVDDDEWFDDVTEFIEFFQSGECEEYYSGYYYTRDYRADGTYSMGIAGRMVRRTVKTRFVGKVHETFNEVYAPNKHFQCFTHHMGYAFSDAEAERKHQERNVSILRQEMKETGYTPRNCAQMMQELMQRKETAKEGYEFGLKCIPILEKRGELLDSCSQWVLTATVRYFVHIQDYENVKRQAAYIRTNYPLSRMAQLVLAAVYLRIASENGDLQTILDNLKIYLEQYDWRLQHEEEALIQTQLDFPRYYSEVYYFNVLNVGATAANYLGEFELANQVWKRFPWEREDFDGSSYAKEMQKTMQGLKQIQEQQAREKKATELRGMLQTLLEAGEYANGLVVASDTGALQELFAGMQEIAIAVGQEVDRVFGEGTQTVTLLEEYCEVVWQCNQAQDTGILCEGLQQAVGLIQQVLQLNFQ